LEQENGNVTLEVKDNGCGIEETKMSDPKSLGLLGMRERALLLGGEVKIKGKSGEGTTVTVRIPIGQSGGSENTRKGSRDHAQGPAKRRRLTGN
jgi:nitrate/nitrite-specific signal transduction histidine kinase